MKTQTLIRSAGRVSVYGAGLAAGAIATYLGYNWIHFGDVTPAATPEEQDTLLDGFMPVYDIVERHRVNIAAPAAITFAAACDMDPQPSRAIRAIFKAREWIMRSRPAGLTKLGGFISQMRAIGWGVLAEVPDREIVMGAVTQPWMAEPVFRSLPPDEFAGFKEPGYVKIVWTLRADPTGLSDSVFRTQTRAVATDAVARSKFRRYWSFVSAGVFLIRRMLLAPLKAEAERRWSHSDSRDGGRTVSLSAVATAARFEPVTLSHTDSDVRTANV